jgi:ribosome-associated protein
MLPTARQFYDLERLWQGAEQNRAQNQNSPEQFNSDGE